MEASAQVAGPGWITGRADPVSPQAAAEYFRQKAAGAGRVSGGATGPTGEIPTAPIAAATTLTPEIIELARGLKNDPKLIYDYVHNHIDYVPYFGSLKGATLTMLDRSGNDFDQASLMIALLRASGISAQYQSGTMTMSYAALQNWGGSQAYWTAVFANGGIPITVASSGLSAEIFRVWVKATINGTDYLFDPAFKSYTSTARIDFAQAMAYNRADLLAAAGGTSTADYCQNINEAAVATKLVSYSSNLVSYLRTQFPNKSLNELLGRRTIVESELASYPTGLPFNPVLQVAWDEVPDEYRTTLRIQHQGIDATMTTPHFAGKRLTITYTSGDFRPQLRLDGELIATGNASSQGTVSSMTLTVDHPFTANNGTYADQTSSYANKSGSTYTIISDFFGDSRGIIQKRQKVLDTARHNGLADNSEAVMGETLNLIGLEWLKQLRLARVVQADLADWVPLYHHRIGRVCQEAGYFIDVATSYEGSTPKRSSITQNNFEAFFGSYFGIGSSLEHAVLEQLMGTDIPGVSTVRLLQIANAQGKKIFYATGATFASSIRAQLQNYTTAELDEFQTKLQNGSWPWMILPADGQLVFGQWKGTGYITKIQTGTTVGLGMMISGNLFGGYSTYSGLVNPFKAIANTSWNVNSDVFKSLDKWFSKDPVEMSNGSFTLSSTDLSLGAAPPFGLSFSRSYISSHNLEDSTTGNGWRHNYDIRLKSISHGDPCLGGRLPVDAAALITASWITLDLLAAKQDAQGWLISSLVSKRATDLLTQNAILVQFGHQMDEFVKLADGTYSPPPGVTSQLVRNSDGTFSLLKRFGTRLDFGANQRVSKLTDVDGNTISFNYSSEGNLTSVVDTVGRNLGFTYTNGRITAAADSTGRAVSYAYNASGDLTGYTDPEGKIWTYGYDSEHRMTSLANPLGITTANMTYDGVGRVKTQTTPRDGGLNATYNFYFSGRRNVEEDPLGKQIVYFYDQESRSTGVQNELGFRTRLKYDGQNHVIESTDRRGNKSTSIYDGNQNLINAINAKGEVTTFRYDSQFRLIEVEDALGNRSQIEYNAKHHVMLSRDGEDNEDRATYLPNGLKQTGTDARGTTTSLTYDALGNPASSKVSTHPAVAFNYSPRSQMLSFTDQVGAITTFEYDKRGLSTKRTDPLGKSTSYAYDNAGQLASVTDRKGQTASYTYTPSGKIKSINAPGVSISYGYDIRDNLVQMVDSIGTTTYSYDEANQLKSQSDPHGFSVSYIYDTAGNISVVTYPGNKVVNYSYDALNRMTWVTTWLPNTPGARYSYDAAGRMTRLDQFNGTYASYSFDKANRLTSLENRRSPTDSICFYRQTLDGNGNPVKIAQNEPLLADFGTGSTAYTYNTQRNRLQAAGSNTLTFDGEGQLANENGVTYTFDVLHRLTRIAGNGNTEFSYDGAGRRIQAMRNGIVTRYVHDARGRLLAEADGNSNITRYYVHGQQLLALAAATGELFCYHFNPSGSTIALTGTNKDALNLYAYEPFGRIVNAQEGISQPLKFAAQFGLLAEPGSELLYAQARYYDAGLGRFLSEDPLEGTTPLTLNRYAFAVNNPLRFTDASGLAATPISFGPSIDAALVYLASKNFDSPPGPPGPDDVFDEHQRTTEKMWSNASPDTQREIRKFLEEKVKEREFEMWNSAFSQNGATPADRLKAAYGNFEMLPLNSRFVPGLSPPKGK